MSETSNNETIKKVCIGDEEKPFGGQDLKYCKHCGRKIPEKAVVCPLCGCQVENLKSETPNIIINNSNDSINTNVNANMNGYGGMPGKWVDKWVAFILCFFFGGLGAHKFYEGKIGMGILYLFTCGLIGIGWLVDTIKILFKPNPYFVPRV